ncbi:general substrate transporter [Pleurotus eryngii]|uniref:General substrate transporter n=1 Tax=Pleurotus eryngii TaxID=5323 RepID=A0A9P5ZNT1_PLEER|nr:general substrate transporter [Pleurotus eryngii]
MAKGYNAVIASNPYVVGSFACIGGALFGSDISSMSAILRNAEYSRAFGNPDVSVQGALIACLPYGALVGALAVSHLGDRLGRKRTIILGGIIWAIGSILQCTAHDRQSLAVARVTSGVAAGISSAIVPIYQSEIAAPSIRGRIVSLWQWSIAWGMLIQYFITFRCSYISGPTSFRIPWGLQTIPAVILSLGMSLFPESPRWLFSQGRMHEALEILADLHGGGDASNESVVLACEVITWQAHFEREAGPKSFADLLKPGVFRRVMLGVSLQMWLQLSGMTMMMYHVAYVFQGTGLPGRRGNHNVAFTIPAIYYIDRWGRRPMLLTGTCFMGVCLMLIGSLCARFEHWGAIDGSPVWVAENSATTRAIIVRYYLFICSFAATMGPVSWTYPAEIFPMKVRGKAVSITTVNWTFSFILARLIPPGLADITKTCLIFGVSNFAGMVHIFFVFPETKQRTLEEVEDIFTHGRPFSRRKSENAVPDACG